MNKVSSFVTSVLVAVASLVGLSAQANDKVHIDPAPGEVSQLSYFLISFDGDWALGPARSAKFTVQGPEGVTIPRIYSGSLGASVGYEVYFEDEAIVSAPGTYIFTIPANKFEVNGIELDEMSFEYTVIGDASDTYTGSVSVNPAPNFYYKIDKIVLEFDAAVEIVDEEAITFSSSESDRDVPLDVQAVDNALVIVPYSLDGAFATPGSYFLQVSAGALRIGGLGNPFLQYRYTIEEDVNAGFPTYNIVPAPGTYDTIDDGFSLSFDTEEVVTANPSLIWLTGPQGDIDVQVIVADNVVRIIPVDAQGELMPLPEPGDYRIIVTMGGIKVGTVSNAEPLVFNYKTLVSSISSVESDTALPTEIFNTQGVRVDSEVKSLPSGVYIINGKKQIHSRK